MTTMELSPPPAEHTAGARAGLPARKLFLFWGLLLVLLLGVLEIGARIGLRVFRGFDGEHIYQYVSDPYKIILPTPNFVDTRGIRHNSVGFRRSDEVPVEKPPETYRIFLMGASTAYGLGTMWPHIDRNHKVLNNSETIDAYLEAILAESLPGTRVEVINAAITSSWTHQHLIYLNQSILEYEPDMVLFLDGFNDFFHLAPDHDQFESYAYGTPARIILGEPSLKALGFANAWWLFRKSAAAHVASRALLALKIMVTPRPDQPPMNVDRAFTQLQATFPKNALAMHERIGRILEGEGVHAVFMMQPLLILERDRPGMPDVERELFEFNVSSYRPNFEAFMHQAVPYLSDAETYMAERVGASFLDLTRPFNGVVGQMYTDYAHLTPQGNRVLAEQIAGHILGQIRGDLAVDTAVTECATCMSAGAP